MAAAVVDAKQRARRVDERAARKAVVHRRRRPQHVVDGPAAAGGSGPPITETMPALAVTALLHERARASAM